MKTLLPRLFLAILLAIAAQTSLADSSGKLLACAKGGYAKENKAPAYLSRQLFGANMLFFSEQDRLRARPEYQEKNLASGFGALRFPGGTVADNYHWARGETDNPRRYPIEHRRSDDDLSFDEFMAMAKSMNAEPSIVLNYLSWVEKNRLDDGYKEAADWLRYANIEKKYGVKYWELGNEVYYFTAGKHINVRARDYARDYKAMKKVLRAIDPSIQLGAVMPQKLDMVAKFDNNRWWDAFLDEVGGELDYIVLHDYPPLTNDEYIAGGTTIPELLQLARQKVASKIGHAVPVHVTEWNIAQWDKKGKHGFIERDSVWQGLFVAESLLDFAVNDVRLAMFWPLRSQDGVGLFSNNAQKYFASGQIFKLLAPYQGQQVLFDCRDQGVRVTRLAQAPGSEAGALLIINKGAAQPIDAASLAGAKARITGLSTFTPENGTYGVKTYSDTEFKALSAKNGSSYAMPSGSLFIFKLSK